MSTIVIKMITGTRRPSTAPSPTLAALFGSRARARVLSHFLLHPGERFHVRELARVLREPPGNLLRVLRRLREIDLLRADRIGNQIRYSMDPEHPLFEDLQRVVLKTEAAGDILKRSLDSIPEIELAFIYGSFATGEATARSDLDVMIVGSAAEQQVAPAIAGAERELGRAVSYTLYTRKDAAQRLRRRGSFLQTVFRGPRVLIIGSTRDALFAAAR